MIPNFTGCFEYNPESNPLDELTAIEKVEFAHAYMEMWVATEGFDDYAIMHESGDTALLADALVGAGAIDSSTCYESCKEIEQIIEEMARTFRGLSKKAQLKRLDKAFKDCMVVRCEDCNYVQFPGQANFHIYEDQFRKSCWECDSKSVKIYPWGKKG